MELDESTLNLCKSVLNEARIHPNRKKIFDFFLSSSDEPVFFGYSTVGTMTKTNNSCIGLPWNFQYKSVDEVDTDTVAVFTDSQVPWKSKQGKNLLDSIVLSEAAKKFVILRQIYTSDSYGMQFHTFNIFLTFMIYRSLSKWQTGKLKNINLATIPFQYKLIVTTLKLLICTIIFYFIRNTIRHGIDAKADLKAIEHGDEYYEGAIEFYSKIAQRNKAIAFFLGDEGKSYYTPAGDPRPPFYHHIFRPIPTPPNARLEVIQGRFSHFQSKDEPII